MKTRILKEDAVDKLNIFHNKNIMLINIKINLIYLLIIKLKPNNYQIRKIKLLKIFKYNMFF